MNVTLSETAARTIEEQMKKGRFATIEDAIEFAVAGLNADEDFDPDQLDALRAEIDIGLAEADRGEFVEFTAVSLIAEVQEALRKEQADKVCQ